MKEVMFDINDVEKIISMLTSDKDLFNNESSRIRKWLCEYIELEEERAALFEENAILINVKDVERIASRMVDVGCYLLKYSKVANML